MDSFSGLSPLVCRELACRSGDNAAFLPEAIGAFLESVRAGELTPTLLTEEGKPKEYSFMQLKQYAGVYDAREFESFSELLDAYYSKRDIMERAADAQRSLATTSKPRATALPESWQCRKPSFKNAPSVMRSAATQSF